MLLFGSIFYFDEIFPEIDAHCAAVPRMALRECDGGIADLESIQFNCSFSRKDAI
jgi:hypothetical protein